LSTDTMYSYYTDIVDLFYFYDLFAWQGQANLIQCNSINLKSNLIRSKFVWDKKFIFVYLLCSIIYVLYFN
jgi:hypothetical protein